MNVNEIKRHVESLGCNIIKETAFSLVSKCGDDIIITKDPESRVKVLVNSNINEISDLLPLPKQLSPEEVTIGKFKKQGSMSRLLKLGGLDEVEYIFGEKDLRKIATKKMKASLERIDRANKFAHMNSHDGIDPVKVIKEEVGFISSSLSKQIEEKIATKVGNNLICGASSIMNPSWNEIEKRHYHIWVKVNCKVPALLDPVTKKLDSIGSWRLFSESDRFHLKSVTPPSGDFFLTGIKLRSKHGKDQLEFEVIDNKKVKNKKFLDKISEIITSETEIRDTESPVNIGSIVSQSSIPD